MVLMLLVSVYVCTEQVAPRSADAGQSATSFCRILCAVLNLDWLDLQLSEFAQKVSSRACVSVCAVFTPILLKGCLPSPG